MVQSSNRGRGRKCPDRLWGLYRHVQVGGEGSVSGVKRPGHDADYSLSSSAEFSKNDWICASTLIVCLHRTECDKFVFFLHL